MKPHPKSSLYTVCNLKVWHTEEETLKRKITSFSSRRTSGLRTLKTSKKTQLTGSVPEQRLLFLLFHLFNRIALLFFGITAWAKWFNKTRLHSSRMRTDRRLTVSPGGGSQCRPPPPQKGDPLQKGDPPQKGETPAPREKNNTRLWKHYIPPYSVCGR